VDIVVALSVVCDLSLTYILSMHPPFPVVDITGTISGHYCSYTCAEVALDSSVRPQFYNTIHVGMADTRLAAETDNSPFLHSLLSDIDENRHLKTAVITRLIIQSIETASFSIFDLPP
jgi:hypothetical protein